MPYNFTWQQARLIAQSQIAKQNLPERTAGATVLVADYGDEQTLRFIKVEEPELTLRSQRMISQALARLARKRGARVEFVPVTIPDYFAWLARFDLADSPRHRAQYVAWLTSPEPRSKPTT